jgi:hypothetical protein
MGTMAHRRKVPHESISQMETAAFPEQEAYPVCPSSSLSRPLKEG